MQNVTFYIYTEVLSLHSKQS